MACLKKPEWPKQPVTRSSGERAFQAKDTARVKALEEDVRKNVPNKVRVAGRDWVRSRWVLQARVRSLDFIK